MSKYSCKACVEIWDAWADIELELNPKDYLYCETFEELREAVEEDLDNSWYSGDIQFDDSSTHYEIPDNFIKEWNKLKGFDEKL